LFQFFNLRGRANRNNHTVTNQNRAIANHANIQKLVATSRCTPTNSNNLRSSANEKGITHRAVLCPIANHFAQRTAEFKSRHSERSEASLSACNMATNASSCPRPILRTRTRCDHFNEQKTSSFRVCLPLLGDANRIKSVAIPNRTTKKPRYSEPSEESLFSSAYSTPPKCRSAKHLSDNARPHAPAALVL